MPHIVHFDLTSAGGNGEHQETLVPASPNGVCKLAKQDFRIHGGGTPHWILRHPLGIDLLVSKLAAERPGMKVPRYRIPPEVMTLLDSMIDLLGMRAWPEPVTLRERLRAGWMFVRYGYCMGAGTTLPDWRSIYNVVSV